MSRPDCILHPAYVTSLRGLRSSYIVYLRSSTFDVTRNRGTTLYIITKHSSALYIGMAKVLPIIDLLGYDWQNSSFSSYPPPSR